MGVTHPAFSERVFEFVFNAEFAHRNRAVLVAAPDIPTQNAEKELGYDAHFEIKRRGGAINSIALQHKVARLVDGASGSNAHIRNVVSLPYFSIGLDGEQFNTIRDIASARLPGVEFHYCAPMFADRKALDQYYYANRIVDNAVWIDVGSCHPLDPFERHTLVYSGSHSNAFVFSKEPQPLVLRQPHERYRATSQPPISDENLRDFYKLAYQRVMLARHESVALRHRRNLGRNPFPTEQPKLRDADDVREVLHGIGELFSRQLGLSWLVEVGI